MAGSQRSKAWSSSPLRYHSLPATALLSLRVSSLPFRLQVWETWLAHGAFMLLPPYWDRLSPSTQLMRLGLGRSQLLQTHRSPLLHGRPTPPPCTPQKLLLLGQCILPLTPLPQLLPTLLPQPLLTPLLLLLPPLQLLLQYRLLSWHLHRCPTLMSPWHPHLLQTRHSLAAQRNLLPSHPW